MLPLSGSPVLRSATVGGMVNSEARSSATSGTFWDYSSLSRSSGFSHLGRPRFGCYIVKVNASYFLRTLTSSKFRDRSRGVVLFF